MTEATKHARTQGEARTWKRPASFPHGKVHVLIICLLVYANRLLIGACYNSKEKAVDS